MAYNPLVSMPLDILSLYVEVTECPGVHLTFPYGYYYDIAHRKDFKDELYDGLIYRVFFYGPYDGSSTILRVYYNPSWYLKTYALGYGNITWSAGANDGKKERQDYSPKQDFRGGFCSLAIELDGNNFRGTRAPSMLVPSGFGTFAVYELVYKGGDKK
ncbi:hypothetical protein MTO96_006323 [Rhipicephalus appendiculatus]